MILFSSAETGTSTITLEGNQEAFMFADHALPWYSLSSYRISSEARKARSKGDLEAVIYADFQSNRLASMANMLIDQANTWENRSHGNLKSPYARGVPMMRYMANHIMLHLMEDPAFAIAK